MKPEIPAGTRVISKQKRLFGQKRMKGTIVDGRGILLRVRWDGEGTDCMMFRDEVKILKTLVTGNVISPPESYWDRWRRMYPDTMQSVDTLVKEINNGS